jgi:hypothetical protein
MFMCFVRATKRKCGSNPWDSSETGVILRSKLGESFAWSVKIQRFCWRLGMPTSAKAKPVRDVAATAVRFTGERMIVTLSDNRELSLDVGSVPWLSFLRDASGGVRNNWKIEPRGFAVYWPDLDDGLEIAHLLDVAQLS